MPDLYLLDGFWLTDMIFIYIRERCFLHRKALWSCLKDYHSSVSCSLDSYVERVLWSCTLLVFDRTTRTTSSRRPRSALKVTTLQVRVCDVTNTYLARYLFFFKSNLILLQASRSWTERASRREPSQDRPTDPSVTSSTTTTTRLRQPPTATTRSRRAEKLASLEHFFKFRLASQNLPAIVSLSLCLGVAWKSKPRTKSRETVRCRSLQPPHPPLALSPIAQSL